MATMNEFLEKAFAEKKCKEVNEMRLSLSDAPKQCQKCYYINSVDHYPSPGGEYFCEHDLFDNMGGRLTEELTRWLFLLADKMKCPLFKKGKRR